MHTSLSPPPARLLLAALALLAFRALSLQAEDVIVTSTLDSIGTTNSCPPSCCDNLGTTTTSSTYSSATPAGITPRKTRFGISSLAKWAVTPTLVCTGRAYRVYVSKGTSGSCPTDILVKIAATSGCTLYDTNGVATPSGIDTPAFQQNASVNVWTPVAIISNSSTTPTITFSWVSGGFNRWYMDEVRFEGLDCCCCGFVPAPGITGPLAAGQTSVNVTALLADGINVTVYANRTNIIGFTNYASGFAVGTITVSTLPLVRGDYITATQTRTNAAGEHCTSDQSPSGPIVSQKFNGTVSAITNTTPLCTGGTTEMGATVIGSGSYTYQWNDSGGPIPGATHRTYIAALPASNPFSVTVSDGACSVTPAAINLDATVRPVTIIGISGTHLIYAGGNGCQFVLLQSSSVDPLLANWTQVGTPSTALPGSFTIPGVSTGAPMYYRIRSE